MTDLGSNTSAELSRLLQAGRRRPLTLRPEELAALWREQMEAPVPHDPIPTHPAQPPELRALAAADGCPLPNLADLLLHPQPPVELLVQTKEYAKNCRADPDGPLPPGIATLLYYTCIAAALVRCQQRITELPDAELRTGLNSCLGQTWVVGPMRQLLQAGLGLVGGARKPPA